MFHAKLTVALKNNREIINPIEKPIKTIGLDRKLGNPEILASSRKTPHSPRDSEKFGSRWRATIYNLNTAARPRWPAFGPAPYYH